MSRPKAAADLTAPFLSPAGASRVTGMSVKWIREGCREGRIPHVIVGRNDYRVNVPLLIAQLNAESQGNCR